MPNPYFLSFELLIYLLFVLCLLHARRRGPAALGQLLAGIAYGWLLEWATIQELHAYHYGHFLLMFGDVPVAVGVAWGVIIYSVMLVSRTSSLPDWAQPVLDGLLALNIDLVMDAVAIRLGMWDWGLGFRQQYFGVPYLNFWAWFWVVFCFSLGLRLLRHAPREVVRRWAPAGAIFIGLVGVTGVNTFIIGVVSPNGYLVTILVALGVALSLMVWLRPKLNLGPPSPLAFWVPFGFHAYFLAAGLLSGALFRPPFLLLVSLGMFLLALYWHRAIWLPGRLGERLSAAQEH
jgi:hypothetical protein